jgi:hypothetical protein
MADFRTVAGAAGVHYVNSTFIISRDTASDIALWGGGPSGEDLTLVALDPDLINFYDISCVSAPLGDHLRRIRLEAKDYGQTTLQARIGPVGATWANAAIAVEGSVIAQGEMFRAHDAPVDGSIPAAIGLASVIRIPVPGTNGLAIELSPRGWTPQGGSTSRLFIQDVAGKRNLRLDYGYNVKTQRLISTGIRRGRSTSSASPTIVRLVLRENSYLRVPNTSAMEVAFCLWPRSRSTFIPL